MSAIGDAVGALCASLGLDPDRLPVEEHVAIDIEDFGELHFERHGDELIVYLSRPISVGDDAYAIRLSALEAVHWQNTPALLLQAAGTGNLLVFLARFDGRSVDPSALNQAVIALGELHEAARAG